jgi:oligoendopeptidase F
MATSTSTQNAVPPRNAISKEYTWNAESVFPNVEAWEAELKAIQASLPEFARFQGHLKEGPAALADALQAFEKLLHRSEVALMYANMSHEVDKTDQSKAALSFNVRQYVP